jgi:hypothetical protein
MLMGAMAVLMSGGAVLPFVVNAKAVEDILSKTSLTALASFLAFFSGLELIV